MEVLQHAACRNYDPEWWFPLSKTTETSEEAKKICWSECPARRECLKLSFRYGIPDGIWGGLDAEQRQRIKTHLIDTKG